MYSIAHHRHVAPVQNSSQPNVSQAAAPQNPNDQAGAEKAVNTKAGASTMSEIQFRERHKNEWRRYGAAVDMNIFPEDEADR
jgi:hypothetical protein